MIGLAFRRMIRCEWSPLPPRGSLPPRVPQRIAPCLRRGDGLDRPHALGVRGDLKSVPVRASAEVAGLVVPRTGCLGHPRLRWRGRRGQPSAEDVHERVVRVHLRRLVQIARAGARVAAVDALQPGRGELRREGRRDGAGHLTPALVGTEQRTAVRTNGASPARAAPAPCALARHPPAPKHQARVQEARPDAGGGRHHRGRGASPQLAQPAHQPRDGLRLDIERRLVPAHLRVLGEGHRLEPLGQDRHAAVQHCWQVAVRVAVVPAAGREAEARRQHREVQRPHGVAFRERVVDARAALARDAEQSAAGAVVVEAHRARPEERAVSAGVDRQRLGGGKRRLDARRLAAACRWGGPAGGLLRRHRPPAPRRLQHLLKRRGVLLLLSRARQTSRRPRPKRRPRPETLLVALLVLRPSAAPPRRVPGGEPRAA
mmetsp:Transcript_32418/g.105900  ORF Transcript_32418/g.105900 Transcript_32418/m.105900 type:complete len:430 (+) Transcript_32418:51-1340(+)